MIARSWSFAVLAMAAGGFAGCRGCAETAAARSTSPSAAATSRGPASSASASAPPWAGRPCPRATPSSCSADGYCLDNPLPTTSNLHAVWGSGPEDVYAVGDHGVVVHFDGATWSTAVADPERSKLTSVFGFGPNDVYVGSQGMILHFDGTRWSKTDAPYGVFTSLWGSGPADLWAGGRDGALHHFDGARWEKGGTGLDGGITSLWGTGPRDVYAGAERALFHFDGERWSVVQRAAPAVYPLGVQAIGGSGKTDVFASWSDGRLLHFDGKSWRPASSFVTHLWSTGPATSYGVLGHEVLRFDGQRWSVEPGTWPFQNMRNGFSGVWADPGGDVVAVGEHGVIAHRRKGTWAKAAAITLRDLTEAWGSGPDDLYVSGDGTLLHFDGCAWSTVTEVAMEVPGEQGIAGIWGSAWNDVFVVGRYGKIRHFDGQGWSTHESGTNKHLFAVWGSAHDRVYAVGDKGAFLRFDGTSWAAHPSPTEDPIYSIAGDARGRLTIVAVSYDVYRFDGAQWTAAEELAMSSRLVRIGADVYVYAPLGVWRHDDGQWTRLPSAERVAIYGFAGTSPRDLVVVGASGAISRFDGTSWKAEASGVHVDLKAVWAGGDVVVAVGEDGTIVRRRGAPAR